MKLKDIYFIKLLPQFMQDDKFNIGLSQGIDTVTHDIEASIDSLSEEELDALAWELGIDWYRIDAEIYVKRQLIKDSRKMSGKLGTKWAVERIINTYFGEGFINEWFEYGGEPGHFKVFSSNPTVTNENLQEFLSILDKVKRASSHLDGIVITLTGRMFLHLGIGIHEASFDTYRIGSKI